MTHVAHQWSFGSYHFPFEDSPARGSSGDWDDEEKLIEHDPLVASVTILTSWGFRSRRRTLSGTCGDLTRDQIRTDQRAGLVADLHDVEGRTVSARIISAKFTTVIPTGSAPGRRGRYTYNITFMAR